MQPQVEDLKWIQLISLEMTLQNKSEVGSILAQLNKNSLIFTILENTISIYISSSQNCKK